MCIRDSPSLYEPWGLVVEEALFRGLPVIASDKVGSAADMVTALETGAVFSPVSYTHLDVYKRQGVFLLPLTATLPSGILSPTGKTASSFPPFRKKITQTLSWP